MSKKKSNLSRQEPPPIDEFRLLIVDDNPYDAELLFRNLQQSKVTFIAKTIRDKLSNDILNKITIEIANTVEGAREIGKAKRIDVAVLDIQLQDGDGIEFLKWIKKEHSETIVIMLTSFSETFFRSLSKRLGADYFLDKSSEFEQIHKILSEIMENYLVRAKQLK